LIAATTTKKGLTVHRELDANTYEKGAKVSDAELAAINVAADVFSPNGHAIKPRLSPTLVNTFSSEHGDLPTKWSNDRCCAAVLSGPVTTAIGSTLLRSPGIIRHRR
jgi:Rhodopirellula transposase DDE domain